MLGKLRFVLLTLVLLGMSVQPAAAINYGEPDAGEHPYVGVVLFTADKVNYYVCSGTLIAPTVFLTAGHCAVDAKYAWVSFDEVPNYNNLKDGWVKGSGVAHPNYDDFAGFPVTYDIGVILLDKKVTDVGYGQLAPLGFLDQYASQVGQGEVLFEAVGYGVNSYKPFFEWEGNRYKAVQRIINLQSSLTDGYNVLFTNNPGVGGGTCSGDSGGPILLNDTNLIVAVNSFGIAPFCKGNDYA